MARADRLLVLAALTLAAGCGQKDRALTASERAGLSGVIYFLSERAGTPVAWRIRPDGTDEARVLGHDGASYPYGASPDGRRIALVESDGEVDHLVLARPDGAEARRAAVAESGVSWYPTFSPDGTRVLFESSREAFRELYVMSVETGAVTRLTDNREGNFDAAWSPDGARIAFASSRHGQLDLFVMNADGSEQRRLTEHAGDSIKPAWAPAACGAKGGRIAFISARDGRDDVYLIGADGADVENLTRSTDEVESFTWRPDGCAIAYAVRAKDKKSKLRILDLATRRVTELSGASDDDASPSWSPDGRWLAFASSRDQRSDLYLMDAEGRRKTRLTQDPESAWLPRWLDISDERRGGSR